MPAAQSKWPWLLNVVLPGTGLIIAGREWLGFLLALTFCLSGHASIAGWLVAPRAWPGWVTALFLSLTLALWLLAQWLLRLHLRSVEQRP